MISLSPPAYQHSGSPPAQRSCQRGGLVTPPPQREFTGKQPCAASLLRTSVDICCDTCDNWYTTAQVGLSVEEADALPTWHCGVCLGTQHKPAKRKPANPNAVSAVSAVKAETQARQPPSSTAPVVPAAGKRRKRSATAVGCGNADRVSDLQSQLATMARINAQQLDVINKLLREREVADRRLCELEGANALPTREMQLSEVAGLYKTLGKLDAEQIATACSFAQVRVPLISDPIPQRGCKLFEVLDLKLLRSGLPIDS